MNKEYKILFVEDIVKDAELAIREIKKTFKNVSFKRVCTQEEFISAFTEFLPDLIISDYDMSAFNGLIALELTMAIAPDIPFIVYTGSLNEDVAVVCMKAGATDYVIKEDNKRLITAIQSAIENRDIRKEPFNAHQNIEESEERLRSLVTILQKQYKNSDDLLKSALGEAVKITTSDLGFLFTFDNITNKFVFSVWSGNDLKEGLYYIKEQLFDIINLDLWAKTLKRGEPIIINRYEQELLKTKKYYESSLKLFRFLIIPVIIDGSIVAAVSVANKLSDYHQSDILLLTLLMDSVWKIHEQKNREQEIRLLSSATEQSPVSIIITDTSGAIKFVNNKFISTTKYSKEDLYGQIFWIFRVGALPEQTFSDLKRHLDSGESWKGELKNIKSSSEIIWEEVFVSTIKDRQGEIKNYLVLSQDISSRKQMELDLNKAKDKAEENDRLKTAFLNNLSHEIRTPLNAIMGFSQLICVSDQDVSKIYKYAEVINQGSKQLLSIMDSIITMAIIETGQFKITPVKSNLNKILNVVYNQLFHKAELKGVSLQSKALFSRYESDVLIDETKVIQVLSNLVENGIKYTEAGYVKFGCSVDKKDILFFIEDTGVGIRESMKSFIFERFRQGLDSFDSFQDGLGLGLSISKLYVESMGGRIEVSSELNTGSKFSFSIPYMGVLDESENQYSDSFLFFSKCINILVVDDVELNASLIEEFVADVNVKVIFASSGRESINMVLNNPEIDMVLMDIKMPDMDGYTAVKEIKKIRPDLPVVAQTAYALAGDKQKSIEAGCDDYLSKPLNKKALLSVIKNVISKIG